jgi:hypothetical protein
MEKYIEEFQKLYEGLDRVHGTYRIDETLSEEGGKQVGKAVTIASPPTAELWEKHFKGERSLGIVPIRDDNTVSWACIDIDNYEYDVCKVALQFIKDHSLPFVVCRSKSGGAHVKLFLTEPVPAKNVVPKLKAMAKAMGFEGSEIFPKQVEIEDDNYGNWLNMPYFDYEISSRYGMDPEGKRLEIDAYIDWVKERMVTPGQWKTLAVPEINHPFSDGPPCLQAMARQGVGEGGRNNALLQFGVYAKEKFGENEYQDKVGEYNNAYFNPPVGIREMTDTVFKSLNRRDYGYVCTQQPQATYCNRAICLRRKYGVGGAADEEFEQEMEMHNLRKLVYFLPDGEPMDDAPEWELTVKGRVIKFTTGDLMRQPRFAEKCINKLSFWPTGVPNARWQAIIRTHLESCEVVEIPFETSPVAQTLEHLKEFITLNGHAKSTLGLLDGLALKKDDCYRFRLESLVEFIREKTRRTVDMRKTSEHLSMLGLKRVKTTVRQGAEHLAVVCWEVPFSVADVYDTHEPDQMPPEDEAAF